MPLFDFFKDTIFLKENSDLQDRYDALMKLKDEYPKCEELYEELYIVKKGLEGENEIKYQLSKSNLGLYVLRDINIECDGLKAQIDYVVLSKAHCYFIECKNIVGNITVNENGDFIREYNINNKKFKKGMYSPLRQVEAQRDVYKKIWNNRLSSNKVINFIKRALSESNFTDTHRVLVVAANNETILNTKYAPKDIKDKVIRADALVRKIQYDLDKSDKDVWDTKKQVEECAKAFLNMNVVNNVNYYEYYKDKFIGKEVIKEVSDDDLKKRLLDFRVARSKEMNYPAYYVFNNEELDKLVELRPKTLDELKKSGVLAPIKVKTHGELIIEIINNK
ncbi:MAG: NERD domain-containing protein [Bacilli bacterium]|nr:NERD domain-containing protein [Bacilli bacterium]